MRKLLSALIFLACCSPAWATWSLTQTAVNNTGTGCLSGASSCAITVSSTGTGHGIIVAILTSNTSADTITAVSGGGTYTHCTNCSVFGTSTGSVDMSYTTSSTSGATTITLTLSAAATNPIGMVWEFSSTTTFAFDIGGTADDAACTACAGASLSLTGSNDFIAGAAGCGATCSGLSGTGWTNDQSNPSGDGLGHGLNVSTSTMTFTQPSAILRAAAIAFKETSGGGGPSTTVLPKTSVLPKTTVI